MSSEEAAASPTKEELIALLKSGKIEEFNRVRPEGEIDLAWANLEGANLERADLRWVCLNDAYLYEANLTRANLRLANLTRANLRGADLTGVDLAWAILNETDLTGAIFTDRQERFFLFRLLDWFKGIFGASWK
jgi:uncharacterized protein YjbI with pentapeptide repeats